MRRNQWIVMSCSMLVCAVSAVIVWHEGSRAVAQTSSSKSKLKTGISKPKSTAETKDLDSRAEKNLESFVAESLKLAADFEKAGHYQEAQDQLKFVHKLQPDRPGVKEKIEILNESVMDSNKLNFEHEVKENWKKWVLVAKGQPVRVEADGEYTLILNIKTDAKGLPTKSPDSDMAHGVRCGALMGLVVPIAEDGRVKTDKIGEPFEIGNEKDFTPKEDGVLLLNVNLPAGHKSIGKLRGTISGHIKTLPPELRR